MPERFFVKVIAKSKQRLIDLQKLELDLFQSTAKSSTTAAATDDEEEKEFSIEGLVTFDDITKLVQNGYKVLVKKELPKTTPAVEETMSFQEWSEVAKEEGERIEREAGEKVKEKTTTADSISSTNIQRIFDFKGNTFCIAILS